MAGLVLSVAILGSPQDAPGGQDQKTPGQADHQTFAGTLTKVDTIARTITVKGTEPEREVVFSYDDQTEIVGADGGVRGLTGNTGAQLKVTYREQRGTNFATKIEVQPKKL